jgi:hypothetical protein
MSLPSEGEIYFRSMKMTGVGIVGIVGFVGADLRVCPACVSALVQK